jgi:xylan 1,4-beta-xylosidase
MVSAAIRPVRTGHPAASEKMKKPLIICVLLMLTAGVCFSQPAGDKSTIRVDMNRELGTFNPAWAWFGCDEPNYTYMKDGRKLLTELSEMSPSPVYFRTHNLLTSGDGTAALKWGSTNVYTENANGEPVYYWTLIDSIFDTLIKRKIKPFVEIGFMPQALSVKPDPYRHFWNPGNPYNDIFLGWSYPPKDYAKWSELVYRWVLHATERYGRGEVETWYWEVWNEPDIKYWSGSFEEYCKLYDYSADAVKRALPAAKVGGPETTNPGSPQASSFLIRFLDHCSAGTNYATGEKGSPLDFISFHAKGAPQVVDGKVRMNMGVQLDHIKKGFEIIAGYPAYKNLPVIIGECDPEGCAACGMTVYPQNGYRNGTMYSSYTASSFAKIYDLAFQYGTNLLGIVSWSFEFENQPWFHGYRDLATNGVGKPVLNVFRMFGLMGNTVVGATSDESIPWREVISSGVRGVKPDIGVLATKNEKGAAIMFWNYHDVDKIEPDAEVTLEVSGLKSGKVRLVQYRIDQDHSNSREAWKKMGSPQHPDPNQYAFLEKQGKLQQFGKPEIIKIKNGKLVVRTSLQRQGVGLLCVETE